MLITQDDNYSLKRCRCLPPWGGCATACSQDLCRERKFHFRGLSINALGILRVFKSSVHFGGGGSNIFSLSLSLSLSFSLVISCDLHSPAISTPSSFGPLLLCILSRYRFFGQFIERWETPVRYWDETRSFTLYFIFFPHLAPLGYCFRHCIISWSDIKTLNFYIGFGKNELYCFIIDLVPSFAWDAWTKFVINPFD